jgi:hypothetical protein
MVIKIRKKPKEGPKGHYAVPLVLAMSGLFGPRRERREFRRTIEDGQRLRSVLGRYFGTEVMAADRPLSPEEFDGWGLKSRPGRLAEMFERTGIIPMGPPAGRPDPPVGLLPLIAVGRGARLSDLSRFLGVEFPEVTRVAVQNILFPAFGLIPGYDTLLLFPPMHLHDLRKALSGLEIQIREEFERAGLICPLERFPDVSQESLASIPSEEPFTRGK